MTISKLIQISVLACSLGASGAAFAKGGPAPAQNHHCKMPDGTMDMAKTHKQCTAAKGTWAKDAAPPKDAAAPTKDAPKTPPATK
jgi:hypothetical protein